MCAITNIKIGYVFSLVSILSFLLDFILSYLISPYIILFIPFYSTLSYSTLLNFIRSYSIQLDPIRS